MIRLFENERVLRSRGYFKRYGLRGTALKILEIVRDAVHPPNYVLYCASLASLPKPPSELPHAMSVISISRQEEAGLHDLKQIAAHRVAQAEFGKIALRFARGACLWMLRRETEVLGFVWAVERKPMQPYFFPLTAGDVHLFDNEVFPEFRGRGLNPLLISTVLEQMRQAGRIRAFIETLERNTPERKSLAKTAFRPIGMARKRCTRRHVVVKWTHSSECSAA